MGSDQFEGQDEIVGEFLVESHENLDRLDRDLLALEKDPSDQPVLASAFRTMHTIKGTAGFLGFGRLESLTHAAESLLSSVRDGELRFSPAIASALLASGDAIRVMLANVAKAGNDGDNEHAELIHWLSALLSPTPEASEAEETEASLPPASSIGDAATASTSPPGETSIRVDVGVLDRLMNLVGELVLTRNQVIQHAGKADNGALAATSQRLNLLTTELQEGVMKTRMQPIGTVWQKFPRVVRDLSAQCHKQIRVEMEGQDTELDRTILEAIKDPLTHALRNAVDHGVESPEKRLAAGKTEVGCIRLRAFHEGGQVNIEISDDGGGIDSARVRDKALTKGLITTEQASRMSERELINLVFLPGFSTAEKLSNVSGRGVGMDVVKHNVEKIGGSIDLFAVLGHGTTLKMKIPLTLAIIPALMVSSGGERYAIPQINLLELVRLEGTQAAKRIEFVGGAPVLRLRDTLLPLVDLSASLGSEDLPLAGAESVNIVVLQADEQVFGLVVGGILDTEEIVVKPLSTQLKGVGVFAGATIMGDGKVALILDVLGLAQQVGVFGASSPTARHHEAVLREKDLHETKFLICEAGEKHRLAVPLEEVHRLEDFIQPNFERLGALYVVQYRGQILPLLWLAELIPSMQQQALSSDEHLWVVVHHHEGRQYGLVVHRILDVVATGTELDISARRSGIAGAAIIGGSVTEIVNVGEAIEFLVRDKRGGHSLTGVEREAA